GGSVHDRSSDGWARARRRGFHRGAAIRIRVLDGGTVSPQRPAVSAPRRRPPGAIVTGETSRGVLPRGASDRTATARETVRTPGRHRFEPALGKPGQGERRARLAP